MPLAKNLSHRAIGSTNLPYVSNNSPTSTEPVYASGSTDILTQITGWCQRRPGFADDVEDTPTVFTNLSRIYTWERFDGSIYIMLCDVTASSSLVYQYQFGVATSATLLFTDSTSTEPYDFVSSNNTVYFSNGNFQKKWDPVNGVTNWGIAIGSMTGAAANYAGTGASNNGNTSPYAWTNPTNAQGAPDASYATISLAPSTYSQYLRMTNYGFGLAGTNTIQGIAVTVTGHTTGSTIFSPALWVTLTYGGYSYGSTRVIVPSVAGDTSVTVGGSADLWDTAWTPIQVNTSSFGADVVALSTPGDTVDFFIDAVQVTIYSSGAPSVSVSGSAGTMTATVGYQYVVTYGNSNTGHISSPTAPSNSTGAFANKLKVTIGVTASTDTQVNQIHVYRTTDSATGLGGQTFFEIPSSPFPNTSGNVDDAAADNQLQVYSIAPTPTFNDPPPAWKGMAYYSGRIWGYINNQVWFTGLEEIINGVPEESIPSGVAGNFYNFDQPVQAIATAGIDENEKLIVFCPGKIYTISGTTLDTFRRRRVANRRGCRNREAVTTMGGMCSWFDTSNQVWATDGTTIQELSIPIRPDLVSLSAETCSMTFHVSGNAHWLILSTGTNLFVYDIDSEQWMPPWVFSCNYIYSGETVAGAYALMAAKPTILLQFNPNEFNDNGTPYSPLLKTNLFSLVPDTPGISDDPSRTGAPWYVEVDTNNIDLDDVSFLVDDDTDTGTYTSLYRDKSAVETTFNRRNGIDINQQIYPLAGRPACRWFGIKIEMTDEEEQDIIYAFDVAYTVPK